MYIEGNADQGYGKDMARENVSCVFNLCQFIYIMYKSVYIHNVYSKTFSLPTVQQMFKYTFR